MDWWSSGVLEQELPSTSGNFLSDRNSITEYCNTPLLQHSNTPSLHHSVSRSFEENENEALDNECLGNMCSHEHFTAPRLGQTSEEARPRNCSNSSKNRP
jgi:hypothetical protein